MLIFLNSSKEKRYNRPSLVVDSKSCGMENTGRTVSFPSNTVSASNANTEYDDHVPKFALRENDYVLGPRKMGGNAQTIIKNGWLHHTSFLWDYDPYHMEYLTLPSKRPDYRGDRSHDDFLVKLKSYYYHSSSPSGGKYMFFDTLKEVTSDTFDLEEVTLHEVTSMIDSELGGMQKWFDGKCRTRILDL